MTTSDHQSNPSPPNATPKRKTRLAMGVFVRGFAMGAADIVPGVSGGTIALITGIYERFILALGSINLNFLTPLLRGQIRESRQRFLAIHWNVLLPIAAGIMFAVATMSSLLHSMMDDHLGPTFAFFFGLIAASSWVPFKLMQQRSTKHIAITLLSAVVVFFLVGVQPAAPPLAAVNGQVAAESTHVIFASKLRSQEEVLSFRHITESLNIPNTAQRVVFDPNQVLQSNDDTTLLILRNEQDLADWASAHPDAQRITQKTATLPWLFFCGLVAISAMLLPGVSGSFLLLMLGQYYAVLGAISRTVHRAMELVGKTPDTMHTLSGTSLTSDLTILLVFNLGVLVGVVLFSRVIRWLLARAHDMTMAALTGLMLGALRQPGRTILEHTDAAKDWTLVGVVMAAGILLVFLLNRLDAATSSDEHPA